MAGIFDGTDFIPLDDGYWGDGATDATTRTLSTRGENQLEGNAVHLRGRVADKLCYDPWCDTAAPAPVTSYDWSARFCKWHQLVPGKTSVTVEAYGAIDLPGGAYDGKFVAKLDVYAFVGGDMGVAASSGVVAWTEAEGNVHTITVDLSDSPLEGAQQVVLVVWLKSDQEDIGKNSGTLTKSDRNFWSPDATVAGATDATTVWRITTATGLNDTVVPLFPRSDGDVAAFEPEIPWDDGSTVDVDVAQLSCFYEEGWAIVDTYDPDAQGTTWVRKDYTEMEAQLPVLGRHTSGHGINIDANYTEPETVAIGPTGRPQPDATWTDNRYPRWMPVRGDAGGELDSWLVRLRGTSSRLELTGWLSLTYIVGDIYRGALEQYVRWLADVSITASVTQLAAGQAWAAAAAAVSETTKITRAPIFDLGYHQSSPLLCGQYLAWHGEDELIASAAEKMTFREGQIYKTDFDVLVPFSVTLSVAAADVDRADPCRVTLEFEPIAAGDVTSEWTSAAPTLSNIRCALVACSVIEHARF